MCVHVRARGCVRGVCMRRGERGSRVGARSSTPVSRGCDQQTGCRALQQACALLESREMRSQLALKSPTTSTWCAASGATALLAFWVAASGVCGAGRLQAGVRLQCRSVGGGSRGLGGGSREPDVRERASQQHRPRAVAGHRYPRTVENDQLVLLGVSTSDRIKREVGAEQSVDRKRQLAQQRDVHRDGFVLEQLDLHRPQPLIDPVQRKSGADE